jgi:membrane peptidoglycan carboxypeptidase
MNNPKRYGLSLVLGGAEVSLLELTSSFLPFSQEGKYRKPTGVLEIKDKNGKILESYKDTGYGVIFPEVAAKVNSILSDNNARSKTFGPSSPLYISGNIAAKTGTTNSYRDGWIIGYSGNTVLGAWIGKNDNTPLGDTAAAVSIAPMWNTIFRKILQKTPAGILDKNYSQNNDVDGLQCARGFAQDILHTALYSGMFPHLSAGDPQLNRWSHGSSYCQRPVDTVTDIIESLPGVTVGTGSQQINIQSVPLNGTVPPVDNGSGNIQIQGIPLKQSEIIPPPAPSTNPSQANTIPPVNI